MKASKSTLLLQTLSLVAGFCVWGILSSLIVFIKEDITLSPGQISLVTAVPIVLGSLLRIPFGYWTNRFGARKMFFVSFVILLLPVFYISNASNFTDLMIGGLFLGVGGATFSIGVTSLPKYYDREKHGFVNGIYGLGNLGSALSTFFAPVLATDFGWRTTVQFYLVLLALFALVNFVIGDRREQKLDVSLMDQIKGIYRNEKLWLLCLFYFITFGAFVAFTVFLPNHLVSQFGIDKVDAGLRTAGFVTLATFMRPAGGWYADKINPFKLLMVVFAGLTIGGIILAFSPSIVLYTAGCLLIGICAGVGNGAIFKLVPLYFSKQSGIANGLISALGGLGGFFPPLMLTLLFSITKHYAIGFMALSMVALCSLLLVLYLYWQDKVKLAEQIVQSASQAVLVTNKKGYIVAVNPAFTAVTGYTPDMAVGQKSGFLKSGRHDRAFYESMWRQLKENDTWVGELWNKKSNGVIYLEHLTITAVKDDIGETSYYVGVFKEIEPVA
ncbi:MFS transporter [Paenibacillus sp. N3/727]|uniref:nitrate/nitrite transporter n=1 Tax=Paenibacillus sp. N3/727 TaxID=2925845 RepID=UPI001F52BDA4|nr:MFS transporter [Paenibacillus sp. N3/727]UNK16251.1 MFS transporter [Paenibacillus sp. N3/727]